MRSSFGTVDFAVVARDGQWPRPARDRDGVEHWQGSVQIDTLADLDELAAYVSVVTLRPALGTFAGTALVEKGPGSATLDVPAGKGARLQRAAVLVGMNATASGSTAGRARADLDFICLGEPA